MPLTLFICGRSRAADPTSSSARRPPIIEDLEERQVGGWSHLGAVGQTVLPSDGSGVCVYMCL
jgi:hypothetical protein